MLIKQAEKKNFCKGDNILLMFRNRNIMFSVGTVIPSVITEKVGGKPEVGFQ